MKDQLTLQKLFGGPALQTQPQRQGKPPKFSTFIIILIIAAAILILIGLIYVTNQTIKLINRIKTARKQELISEPSKKEVTEDITYEEVKTDSKDGESKEPEC